MVICIFYFLLKFIQLLKLCNSVQTLTETIVSVNFYTNDSFDCIHKDEPFKHVTKISLWDI